MSDSAASMPQASPSRWMRPLAIFGSVLLHALAFPPWNVTWTAWIALVPFLLAVRGLTPLRGFGVGWLWGTAAIWVVAYWVPAALRFYYQQPWWFVILFCVIGSQILWGTYYAVFGAVACRVTQQHNGLLRVVATSAAWVAAELARARLLTGEPWMLLGYALIPDLRMIQAADAGGVYLLSFVVIFVNAALAEMIVAVARVRRTARGLPNAAILWRGIAASRGSSLAAAALVVAVWLYGGMRLGQSFSGTTESRVLVVQGNVPLGALWREDFYAKGLAEYLQISKTAAQEGETDLIVWPESAVTFFLPEEPAFLQAMQTMVRTTGADLIVGGPHLDRSDESGARFFNSAYYVTAGGIEGRYDKAHLLPFGEYFPLKTIEFLRRRFERVRTFTSGDGLTLLDTRAGKAAVVICFEAVFPEIVRRQMALGADFLVNLSNDAWLGSGAGPRQHASMVVLRAVENRTWVVRATTTGVSAIIDPHGRIVAQSDTGAAAVLRARVAALRAGTVYETVGDAFAYACVAVTALFLATTAVRRRRRRWSEGADAC